MSFVYEIEYEYSQFGYTDTFYVVADTLDDVFKWIKKNSKYRIIDIKKLGSCELVIER